MPLTMRPFWKNMHICGGKPCTTTQWIGWQTPPDLIFFHRQHIHLSGVLVKRDVNYTNFLKLVHSIIFRMHVQLQTVRGPRIASCLGASLTSSAYVLHVCPVLVHDNPPTPLTFKIDREEFDQRVAQQPSAIREFARLLTHCNIAYNSTSSGLTWHEIHIYIISGAISRDFTIFQKTTAVAAKSIFQQVREFAISAIAFVKN